MCDIHGDKFMIDNILVKNKCSKCFRVHNSKIKFIAKAKSKYGNKFNYSKVNYINNRVKIDIMCNNNHTFHQSPDQHLKIGKCKVCTKSPRISSSRKFIDVVSVIHYDKYSYSKTKFSNLKNIITIECPFHGYFQKIALEHLKGDGCPKCSNEIINKFLLEIDIEEIKKIENTNTEIVYVF